MNKKECLGIIEKELSSEILSHKEIHQGTFNIVFEINEQWIFRFTREKTQFKQLDVEKNFLLHFFDSALIQVPRIEYSGSNFIGYRKIQGVPLVKDIVDTLNGKQIMAIWESLGLFITQLHESAFTHQDLSAFPYGGKDFWEDLWEPVKNDLSTRTRELAHEYFVSYFLEAGNEKIETTICHGDLHPNHILYDADTHSISGIIDFGNICLNDPAIDFNLFERLYGDEALISILQFYNRSIEPNFRKRITFQNRKRLFDAIFRARTLDYPSEIPRYLQRIEGAF